MIRRSHVVSSWSVLLAGLTFTTTAVAPAVAQCKIQEFTGSDTAVGDLFGSAVAVQGTVAVIGAQRDGDFGLDSGSAYIFRFDGNVWTEEQKVHAADAAPDLRFGNAVAAGPDTVAIASVYDDHAGEKSGAVYVYRFSGTTWQQQQKLIASDGAFDDRFGISVSLDNDVIVTGAVFDDDDGSRSGSAYVFRFDPEAGAWIQEQKLTASDAASSDRFGLAVAVGGDAIVVSAIYDDDAGGSSGSAYVFRFDPAAGTWVQEQKLTASDADATDQFGTSVAIEADIIVIGAIYNDDDGTNSGSAYVFRFDPSAGAWTEEQKLTAADAEAGDEFGSAVAVDDGVIVVGAHRDNSQLADSGSAYVFKYDGQMWRQVQKLAPSDVMLRLSFGSTVSISGGIVLVGTGDDFLFGGGPFQDGSNSVFVYDVEADCNNNGLCDDGELANDCNDNGVPDECDLASGASRDCNGDGVPDECPGCTADCECDDGNACTVNDACIAGTCAAGTPLQCDDGDPCNGTEACDPASGTCLPGTPIDCDDHDPCNGLEFCSPGQGGCVAGAIIDCNGNNIDDACDLIDCAGDPACQDCNANASPDGCDIASGVSTDVNDDGRPDECEPCTGNASCDDGNVCDFATCALNVCFHQNARYGDVAGFEGACGPDGQLDIFDILAVLDAFQSVFADGCAPVNLDISGTAGGCTPDGQINIFDVFAVLDAFQGIDPCCGG